MQRFIGLTGTPAPNGIKDLWGQTYFIDKGERLGKTFSAFEQRWFRKGYDGYSLVPYDHSQTEVMNAISDIYLTVKSLQVDEPISSVIPVKLPPAVRAAYDAVEKELFAEIEIAGVGALEIEAANAAVRLGKCLQIASGAVFEEGGKVWQKLHDAKLDALESIVEEANGMPVLVSYAYTHDAERILKRFKQARMLDGPETIRAWNAGKIPVLVAHPACLHPETEVLTERRGWLPIIEVTSADRVFDGAEFVEHRGCWFSGVKPVVDVFGVKATPEHKFLVDGDWREAQDVRGSEDTKRKALYTYAGADPYLSAMLPLRDGASGFGAERAESKPGEAGVLPALPGGRIPPHDQNAFLADMEGCEGAHSGPRKPGLRELWRRWARVVFGLAPLRELLQGHVRWVRGPSYDRARRQCEGVQQGQLPLGNEHGAASQQGEQPVCAFSGPRRASGGTVQDRRSKSRRDNPPACEGCVGGRGGSGLPEIALPAQSEISEVYDLVDCGPRNRFLVRNSDGEVFTSHNSAGHGLNLQDGGNILAFFGLTFNLEHYMQIIERIGPLRQKQSGYDRPVYLYHIVAEDTFDQVALDRLAGKRSVQDAVLKYMQRRKK